MPAIAGRAAAIIVNTYDLSAFFKEAEVAAKSDQADTTTFGATAHTKLATLRDGQFKASGYFDQATNASDAVLAAALGGTGQGVTYAPAGLAVGNPVKLLSALTTDYAVKQAVTGIVENSMSVEADGGIDTGISLHALVAETATGNGIAVDNGAATTNGGVAHLHILPLTGTTPSITPKIQHSVDGSTWVDLVTWGAYTVANSSRFVVPAGTTVNRHLRATWTIGGTSVAITFALSFARR